LMRSVFIGHDARALATDDTDSIVIGAGARGRGSNTTVIGADTTTLTRLQGTVETTGSFQLSSVASTDTDFERLSLSWNASVAQVGTSMGGTGVAQNLDLIAGGLRRVTLNTASGVGIQGLVTTDSVGFGTELLANGGWTATAGWTGAPNGPWTHSAGTTTLSHNATIVNAQRYQCVYTLSGVTGGSVTIAFGGRSVAGVTASGSFGPTAASTAGFTVTPTNDFVGTISVSLLPIASNNVPHTIFFNSAGVAQNSIRAPTAATSTFFGTSGGMWVTTGTANSGYGSNALQNLTSGNQNTALGARALINLTTGVRNTAIGYDAGSTLSASTVAYHVDDCVFIGSRARPMANLDVNSIAIGSGVVGIGSNTTIIGSAAITKTRLQGTVDTTLDFESLTAGSGVLLRSPNGTRYRISVNDAGAVIATAAP
jgi:trimeric autotransporter adhesin